MPPSLALSLWLVLLVGLLCFDPAKEPKTSLALWVPLIWIFFLASRTPAQWVFGMASVPPPEVTEQGNPFDRTIYLVLILLGISILVSRSFKWGAFFARNVFLTAFLFFALLSVLWSDFPFVAFKRWFRDLGNYVAILIVLSDPRPLEAVRTVFRRLCYLLIPLSILLIKYFPDISRKYDEWTGAVVYRGPTSGKNLLGALCLVSVLFFFWDTVTRWPNRKERRTRRIILVNASLIAMTLWPLHLASSATCHVCLLLGCLVIAAAHSKAFQRHPGFLKALIPVGFVLYVILALGFDLNAQLAGAVGRNPTLTDRTRIWAFLLSMHTNPLLGTGYESFWLGSRLLWFWNNAGLGKLNEAHNGYLEVYLNLGLIGLLLLGGFLIASYRTICRRLRPFSSFASLALALWIVFLFYNVTEAGFRSGLMWLAFLLGAIAVPERAENRVRSAVSFDNGPATEQLPVASWK
jgi:O-antigen ligase